MKTELFWFSGTGNTLYLAQRLADELGDTQITPIAHSDKQTVITSTADKVGILFPIYCFGTPLIIKRFLKKLQLKQGAYLFGCASYGGLLAAGTTIFRKEAKEAGLHVSAAFAVQMPGNAITTYGRIPDASIKKYSDKFEKRIPEIASKVKSGKSFNTEQFPFPFNWMLSVLHKPFMTKMPEMVQEFYNDEKSCNECGDCAKLCPMGNITLEGKKVVWGDSCEQCMGCIQWCPTQSIQGSAKTAERERYNHSCIAVSDLQVG